MPVPKYRKTARDFGSDKLTPKLLANLLWAAFGVNCSDGRQTAPSAQAEPRARRNFSACARAQRLSQIARRCCADRLSEPEGNSFGLVGEV